MSKSFYSQSMWSGLPIKLSILVPTRDMVHSHFAYCLTQLVKTTTQNNIDTYVFFDSNTILLNQRTNLIKRSLEVKSDYVLWLDSDMMFPSTTALRLLNHDKDIVACNYMKRTKPQNPVAYKDITDWNSFLPLTPQEELVPVEGIGMGCMLMKTEIFNQLDKPYFKFVYKEDSEDWHGEDFDMLSRLRKLGYIVYVDSLLSLDIKHLGNQAFGV